LYSIHIAIVDSSSRIGNRDFLFAAELMPRLLLTEISHMKKLFLFVLFMTLMISALSAQEIDKLQWMSGTWLQSKDKDSVEESWVGPRNKVMVGVNLTVSARRGTSYEFLRIVEGTDGLRYFASPGGKTPVEFKLKEISDKKVVFENLAHDFPQRILYWLDADGALKARIEGTMQGKERALEWRFEKVKSP
jgi:hypothetical protein